MFKLPNEDNFKNYKRVKIYLKNTSVAEVNGIVDTINQNDILDELQIITSEEYFTCCLSAVTAISLQY